MQRLGYDPRLVGCAPGPAVTPRPRRSRGGLWGALQARGTASGFPRRFAYRLLHRLHLRGRELGCAGGLRYCCQFPGRGESIVPPPPSVWDQYLGALPTHSAWVGPAGADARRYTRARHAARSREPGPRCGTQTGLPGAAHSPARPSPPGGAGQKGPAQPPAPTHPRLRPCPRPYSSTHPAPATISPFPARAPVSPAPVSCPLPCPPSPLPPSPQPYPGARLPFVPPPSSPHPPARSLLAPRAATPRGRRGPQRRLPLSLLPALPPRRPSPLTHRRSPGEGEGSWRCSPEAGAEARPCAAGSLFSGS